MKKLRIIACLLTLFILGAFCGASLSAGWIRHQMHATQWQDRWIDSRMEEDSRRLDLSPRQMRDAAPLYDELLSEINSIRTDAAQQLIEAGDRHYRDLAALLNPRQQEELQQLIRERSARWQESRS